MSSVPWLPPKGPRSSCREAGGERSDGNACWTAAASYTAAANQPSPLARHGGRVSWIQSSAAMRCTVKLIQNAVPRISWTE